MEKTLEILLLKFNWRVFQTNLCKRNINPTLSSVKDSKFLTKNLFYFKTDV